MRTIPADYNAATTTGALRLNFHDSRRALHDLGSKPGDWAWLSDGEVVVGARLEGDSEAGLVGVPQWETTIHLDDPEAGDFEAVFAELRRILDQPSRSREMETRALQLLTIFEAVAPSNVRAVTPPGFLPLRRAGALYFLGELGLALVEIEDALGARPADPDVAYFYLETLRRLDPDRALGEAEIRAEASDASAQVLAACINIWSAAADQIPDDRFSPIGGRILDWIDRFERATGRDRIHASVLAQVQFNRGLLMLRLGRRDEARNALDQAHASDPSEAEIVEARALDVFDDRARSIAERFRSKTQPLVAA